MTEEQITAYGREHLQSVDPGWEENPRLVNEGKFFLDALLVQVRQLKRVPLPQQIEASWERWKQERIHGLDAKLSG
jgi:hypothetical protein